MLKIGEKKLFIHDYMGRTHEMSPLCVLDFYVHDKEQRKGYGKRLFDYMIQMENVNPAHLAIDKPSEKSIKFLKKHYNLKNPIGQVNNFVVFDGFFDNRLDLMFKRKQTELAFNNRKYDVLSAAPLQNNRTNLPPLPNVCLVFLLFCFYLFQFILYKR